MSYVIWFVVGAIVGFVSSKTLNRPGSGVVVDIALGVVGAVICGYVATLIGIGGVSGLNLSSLYSIVVAAIGAALVPILYRSVVTSS